MLLGVVAPAATGLLSGCVPQAAAPAAPAPAASAPAAAGATQAAPAGTRSLSMAYDAVQFWIDQANEFTAQTGIDFKYESIPFPQLHDKYLASFMSGGKEYDVVHVRDDYVVEWGSRGWLDPIDARLDDTLKGLYFPSAFKYLTYENQIYGMPRYVWLWQFYYNTDLFEKAGVKDLPKTWGEMRDVAKKLTNAPDHYGFVAALGATLPVNLFSVALRAEGSELLDGRKPIFNSAAGAVALQYLVDMVQDGSVDPSSFALTTTTAMTDIFTQGRAAMCLSTPPTLALAADPAKSKTVGQVQVGLIPGGTKEVSAGYSELGGVAITNTSADKDAAWEYLKFVCSQEQQKKMALAIGRIPTIPALLDDPEVQKGYPAATVAKEQMKYPMGMSIVVPEQAELNKALANELVAALQGQKQVKQALADAEAAALTILNK